MNEEKDPLIDDIHAIRREIAEEFGDDPARLVEHYIEYQKQFKDRLVSKRDLDRRKSDRSAA